MMKARNRRCRQIAFLFCLAMLTLCAMPAWSQMPPIRPTIDENGVDLFRGTIQLSSTDLAIGPPGSGGLSYTRALIGDGWRDNYTGMISSSGNIYFVSVGDYSESFVAGNSNNFGSREGLGASMTYANGIYTVTTKEGTVITFDSAITTSGFLGANRGFIKSMTRPNGEKLTFHYTSTQYCDVWDCSGSITTYYRIQSVTNNFGYQLRWMYNSDDAVVYDETLVPWLTMQAVVGINMKDEYCDPDAASCAVSSSWPSVSYSGVMTAGGLTVTDPAGEQTTYTLTGTFQSTNRTFSIRFPGSTADDVTVALAAYNGVTSDMRVTSVARSGTTTSYNYPADTSTQRTVEIKDALNNKTTIIFDLGLKQPVSQTNPATETTTYDYDDHGRLQAIHLPSGERWAYTYDWRGNVTMTEHDPPSTSSATPLYWTAEYEAPFCTNPVICNQPHWTKDPKGNNETGQQTDYTYDSTTGAVLTITLPQGDNGVRPKTTYTYDSFQAYYKNSATTSAASGQSVKLLTRVSTCRTTSNCQDTADELRTEIDFGLPNTGNNLLPVQVTTRNGVTGTGAVSSVVKNTYDAIGNTIAVDGPLPGAGDTTLTFYDKDRRVTGQVGPDPEDTGGNSRLPRAIRTIYDTRGLPATVDVGTVPNQSITDLNGMTVYHTQVQEFDAARRLVKQTLKSGTTPYEVTQTSYDSRGLTECIATRMNLSATVLASLPDACTGTAVAENRPDQIRKLTYDDAQRLRNVSVGVGYSASDQITVRQMMPDGYGRLDVVYDANGNITHYTYDDFGRVKRIYYANAANGAASNDDYEEFTYNFNSQIVAVRRRDNQTTSFFRDALDLVIHKVIPGTGGGDVYYGYDNHGRVLYERNGSPTGSGITMTYDGLGRMDSRTVFGRTIGYQYDEASRRSRLTYPDSYYVSYNYNNVDDLLSITDSTSTIASYSYDPRGRLTSVARPNNTSTGYLYDDVDRVSRMTEELPGTGYDRTADFTYAPSGQLATRQQSNEASYAWAPGAPATISAGFDRQNRLTSFAGASVSVTSKGEVGGFGGYTYSYDAEGKLRSATVTVSGQQQTTNVDYDPEGMLQKVTAPGNAAVEYVYDGADLIAEYVGGTIQRRYVHGGGLDTPIVWDQHEASGWTRRFLHSDERGSVIAVSDSSGAGEGTTRYSPQGQSSGLVAPFGFTGQLWLGSINLYYFKARMYSAETGRFMQPDPVGYGDGMNLYAYAGNDPVNFSDPFGTDATPTAPGELCHETHTCDGPDVSVTGCGPGSRDPSCAPNPDALDFYQQLQDEATRIWDNISMAIDGGMQEVIVTAWKKGSLGGVKFNHGLSFPKEQLWAGTKAGFVLVPTDSIQLDCSDGSSAGKNFPVDPNFTLKGYSAAAHLHPANWALPFPGPEDGAIPRAFGIPNYGFSASGVWVIKPGPPLSVELLAGSWGKGPNGETFSPAAYTAAINNPGSGGKATQCHPHGTK